MEDNRQIGCDALVVTCMDFRLQKLLDPWLARVLGWDNYDRVSVAGAAKALDSVLRHVDTAVRLHDVQLVLLLNHEDCGAYAGQGTPQRHQQDLWEAAKQIRENYAGVTVLLGYLTLDGVYTHVPEEGAAMQPLEALIQAALRS